jgi:hypothetical protein
MTRDNIHKIRRSLDDVLAYIHVKVKVQMSSRYGQAKVSSVHQEDRRHEHDVGGLEIGEIRVDQTDDEGHQFTCTGF